MKINFGRSVILILIFLLYEKCSVNTKTSSVADKIKVGCPEGVSQIYTCDGTQWIPDMEQAKCIADIAKDSAKYAHAIVLYSDNDYGPNYYYAKDVMLYRNSRVSTIKYPLTGKEINCGDNYSDPIVIASLEQFTVANCYNSNSTLVNQLNVNCILGGDIYTDVETNDPDAYDQNSEDDFSKVVYIYFYIQKYKESIKSLIQNTTSVINSDIKEEIRIYYNQKVLEKIQIEYNKNDDRILWIYPSSPPSTPEAVQGVIKTKIVFPSTKETSDYSFKRSLHAVMVRSYPQNEGFTKKTVSPFITNESADDYSSSISIPLSNKMRVFNSTDSLTARKMTLVVFGNGIDTDLTSYTATTKDGFVTFQQALENAWSDVLTSDIHAKPDYVKPSGSFAAISLPNILFSADGYILLDKSDLEYIDKSGGPLPTAQERLDQAIYNWKIRFSAFLTKAYANSYSTSFYSTLNLLDLDNSPLNYSMNRGHILVCKGYRAIDLTKNIDTSYVVIGGTVNGITTSIKLEDYNFELPNLGETYYAP